MVITFSHFRAIFPLISPTVLRIFTPNFTTIVRKICLDFWYPNQSGFENNWGVMLWIMSGTDFDGNRNYKKQVTVDSEFFFFHDHYFVKGKEVANICNTVSSKRSPD